MSNELRFRVIGFSAETPNHVTAKINTWLENVRKARKISILSVQISPLPDPINRNDHYKAYLTIGFHRIDGNESE